MVTRSEFFNVERDVIEVQQHSRRNNVEISGLPENLTNFQSSIIKLVQLVGIKIKPDDIQACHHLPKGKNHRGPMKVIARFVNRKTSESLIRSNKKFVHRDVFEKAGLHEKIYINNSLSNYNKNLRD